MIYEQLRQVRKSSRKNSRKTQKSVPGYTGGGGRSLKRFDPKPRDDERSTATTAAHPRAQSPPSRNYVRIRPRARFCVPRWCPRATTRVEADSRKIDPKSIKTHEIAQKHEKKRRRAASVHFAPHVKKGGFRTPRDDSRAPSMAWLPNAPGISRFASRSAGGGRRISPESQKLATNDFSQTTPRRRANFGSRAPRTTRTVIIHPPLCARVEPIARRRVRHVLVSYAGLPRPKKTRSVIDLVGIFIGDDKLASPR